MFTFLTTRSSSSSSDPLRISELALKDLARLLAGVGGLLFAACNELGRPVAGGLIREVAKKYGEALGAEDGVAWPGGGLGPPEFGAELGLGGARHGVATGAIASVLALNRATTLHCLRCTLTE